MWAIVFKDEKNKYHIGELTLSLVPGIGTIEGMIMFYRKKGVAKKVLKTLDQRHNLQIIKIKRVIYEYADTHVILSSKGSKND